MVPAATPGESPAPLTRQGTYTVAPGQYGNIHGTLEGATVDAYELTAAGAVYLVAHATVCR